MKRCFVAIDLSEKAKDEIVRIQEAIQEENLFLGKFVERENLHLTLKFLGEISEAQIEGIISRLNGIEFGKLKVRLGKVGMFGERIIWVELVGTSELQKEIDGKLNDLFVAEERFMSHITIARPKKIREGEKLMEFLDNVEVSGEEFEIDEFSLKSSVLGREGARYTDVFTKKLSDE